MSSYLSDLNLCSPGFLCPNWSENGTSWMAIFIGTWCLTKVTLHPILRQNHLISPVEKPWLIRSDADDCSILCKHYADTRSIFSLVVLRCVIILWCLGLWCDLKIVHSWVVGLHRRIKDGITAAATCRKSVAGDSHCIPLRCHSYGSKPWYWYR
jgi:hypothetical protein